MANTCTNRIQLHANQSTIDWFEELVEDFMDSDFIEQFGSKGNNNIDRIGCKWVIRDDYYREDETEYMLGFESAWYPPDTMIKNIVAQLQERDEHAYADGRYWDENFDPIGIFHCNSPDKFETAEITIEPDWEDEMYWDNEIEPAFEELEL